MDIGIELDRHQQRVTGLTISPDLLDHSTSVAYVTAAIHSPCSTHNTTPVYSLSQQQQQRRCCASRCAFYCTILASSIVFNILIWSAVLVLVFRSSLMKLKEDEKQLNSCLDQMVCSEITTWDEGNSSMQYSSQQQQQQQQQHSHSHTPMSHAVNNRAFYIQQTGIYLVHSHLAFKANRQKTSVIFEHEIRSKVGDSASKCLVRDAQDKQMTHCTVAEASCHTTVIVSTLFLRHDSNIFVSAEPASLLNDPTNTAVFNITRLN